MPEIEFDTSDGIRLEGRLTFPDKHNGGVAVLCHPHPQHGGSMHSWMMPVLQRTLVDDGWIGLRFNFRGVGDSEGSHDKGEGELDDVAAAIDRVLEEGGAGAPLLVGGWSFGAHVSLRHSVEDDRVSGWFGVGFVFRTQAVEIPDVDLDALGRWEKPKLWLHGSRDEFTSVEAIEEVVEAAAEPKRLRILEDGDHFLADFGDELSEEVHSFARLVLDGVDSSGTW